MSDPLRPAFRNIRRSHSAALTPACYPPPPASWQGDVYVHAEAEQAQVRAAQTSGTAVQVGNSGAALDAAQFQLISAGTGQDSAAGLFQYENRNEASLNQGEREALDALRREYPGESITPVGIRDVRRSPDGATRGSSRD